MFLELELLSLLKYLDCFLLLQLLFFVLLQIYVAHLLQLNLNF